MSNYEANPVGFLQERYQSSGCSPLYEVVKSQGQAHAPVFSCKLTVPQGHTVTASANSKKIAKNNAAKMMLDKLEKVEGQSKLVQNTKIKIMDVNKNCVTLNPQPLSNSPSQQQQTSRGVTNLPAQESSQHNSVADFLQEMRARGGEQLAKLQSMDLVALGWNLDCCSLVDLVAEEQGFSVTYREVRGQHGETEPGLSQCHVRGRGAGGESNTVCLGEGSDPGQARQSAARTALFYIKTMTRQEQQGMTDMEQSK